MPEEALPALSDALGCSPLVAAAVALLERTCVAPMAVAVCCGAVSAHATERIDPRHSAQTRNSAAKTHEHFLVIPKSICDPRFSFSFSVAENNEFVTSSCKKNRYAACYGSRTSGRLARQARGSSAASDLSSMPVIFAMAIP